MAPSSMVYKNDICIDLSVYISYSGSFLWRTQDIIPYMWGKERGDNLLDGGTAFYNTYETSDGKYVSVGALEPQFFNELLKGMVYYKILLFDQSKSNCFPLISGFPLLFSKICGNKMCQVWYC